MATTVPRDSHSMGTGADAAKPLLPSALVNTPLTIVPFTAVVMANVCVHASDGSDSDSDGGQGGRGDRQQNHCGNSAFAVQKTAKRPGMVFFDGKVGEGCAH